MSPRDEIPNLRGQDGEGSVQVHQPEDAKIEGAKVFAVYGIKAANVLKQTVTPTLTIPLF